MAFGLRSEIDSTRALGKDLGRAISLDASDTQKFEEGVVNATTGKRSRRPLKRDQVFFVARFAAACDAVWDDEQSGCLGKRRFNMLLLGQGGSGKTAVVQEIVLPAMDSLFPPAENSSDSSSLIVCAKWSQALAINTPDHKAESIHGAASMGIGKTRNSQMLPGDKKRVLERKWAHLKLLVIEEVSMVSPQLYNMLLYRSWHGRRSVSDAPECEYDTLTGAFGQMPIVIHLGDFLQLRPTGTGLSLIAGDDQIKNWDIPAEHQFAMKLFQQTPLCFELLETSRFRDPVLKELMTFVRTCEPDSSVPKHLQATWKKMLLKKDDARLREERFQVGHFLAIYWDSVARSIVKRARRDASATGQVLYLLQAADACKPLMPTDLAKKLVTTTNPGNTGLMHGMLPLHVGMHVRLLDHKDKPKGLVKDATGEVVRVEIDPRDADLVAKANAEAAAGRPGEAYLTRLPHGIWLRMHTYHEAPFVERLREHACGICAEDAASLYFLEPSTQTFTWRGYSVSRTGFPLSHAKVLTSTAVQGRTLFNGVAVDCGRRDAGQHPISEEDYWLNIYVMLSRATCTEDLLLARAPPASFLGRGPPKDLAAALRRFADRTQACREEAGHLAKQFGLVVPDP